jgi:hypothetical protein
VQESSIDGPITVPALEAASMYLIAIDVIMNNIVDHPLSIQADGRILMVTHHHEALKRIVKSLHDDPNHPQYIEETLCNLRGPLNALMMEFHDKVIEPEERERE